MSPALINNKHGREKRLNSCCDVHVFVRSDGTAPCGQGLYDWKSADMNSQRGDRRTFPPSSCSIVFWKVAGRFCQLWAVLDFHSFKQRRLLGYRSLTRALRLAVLIFVTGCATLQISVGEDKRLFAPLVGPTEGIEQAQIPRVTRRRFVRVEFDLLYGTDDPSEPKAANRGHFLLNLFDDATFKAVLNRREVRSDKSFTWFGRVEEIEDSQITLVVEDSVLVGNVRVHDASYQVRYIGEGVHVVNHIDPRTFPPESAPVVVPSGR